MTRKMLVALTVALAALSAGTARAGTTFIVCDPSGFGQGETYLGTKTSVADPFGNLTFSVHFPLAPSAPTPIVTSTATDQFGSTSEFSACSSGG